MSDSFYSKISSRVSGAGVGTTAGATVTLAAPTGAKGYTCAGIQCSGDAAALVTIESPSATVLWRKRFAGAFTMSERFELGNIKGAAAAAMLVKISASTANCEANIQAFVIPA